MTTEQELDVLKSAVLQTYAEYYEVVRNTTISNLSDYNKRRRLIEAFASSVYANAAFRHFLSEFKMNRTTDHKGFELTDNQGTELSDNKE
jgi:hypothetical protein